MNFLLDSHSLLWSLFTPSKLSPKSRSAIEAPANEIYVSHVSFWELALKYAMKKLNLHGTTPEELPFKSKQQGFRIISITEIDCATFNKLPRLGHKDPFDRMLIWQAINRNFTLISNDREIDAYETCGLKIFW
jgi:PIN domain nuclease of toxin-antitoxin system